MRWASNSQQKTPGREATESAVVHRESSSWFTEVGQSMPGTYNRLRTGGRMKSDKDRKVGSSQTSRELQGIHSKECELLLGALDRRH